MASIRKHRVPPLTDRMYERGRETAVDTPFDVVAARYDVRCDHIRLKLRNGFSVGFPRAAIREIAQIEPADLGRIEIQPGGDGVSFRRVDVDISVPGLLADELGGLFAKALGRKTRGVSTARKAAASRANGRKGGRPRKAVA